MNYKLRVGILGAGQMNLINNSTVIILLNVFLPDRLKSPKPVNFNIFILDVFSSFG